MSEPSEPFIYEGFTSPTYTQVPDEFFDVVVPRLTEAELKVALYIIRRTYGFKKTSDTISLRQMTDGITTRDGQVLDHGTGLNKSSVARALNSLEAKGIIVSQRNRSAERGDQPTTYTLHTVAVPLSLQGDTPVSPEGHPLSLQRDTPMSPVGDTPVSLPGDTQETVLQETVEQETDTPRPPQAGEPCALPSAEGIEEEGALESRGAEENATPQPPATPRWQIDDVEGRLHSKSSERYPKADKANGWKDRPDTLSRMSEVLWKRWSQGPNKIRQRDLKLIPRYVAADQADAFRDKTEIYLQSLRGENPKYMKQFRSWLEEWQEWAPARSFKTIATIHDHLLTVEEKIALGVLSKPETVITHDNVARKIVPEPEPEYLDLPF